MHTSWAPTHENDDCHTLVAYRRKHYSESNNYSASFVALNWWPVGPSFHAVFLPSNQKWYFVLSPACSRSTHEALYKHHYWKFTMTAALYPLLPSFPLVSSPAAPLPCLLSPHLSPLILTGLSLPSAPNDFMCHASHFSWFIDLTTPSTFIYYTTVIISVLCVAILCVVLAKGHSAMGNKSKWI